MSSAKESVDCRVGCRIWACLLESCSANVVGMDMFKCYVARYSFPLLVGVDCGQ